MKFKLVGTKINVGILADFKEEILGILNTVLIGLVYIENGEDSEYSVILNVTKYTMNEYSKVITSHFNAYSREISSINNIDDVVIIDIKDSLIDSTDKVNLDEYDTIYKIMIDDEKRIEPRIRWWNDGKLENLKTFEKFNK